MVLALQIVLAACFVGIAVDMFIDINKNHKGECKNAGAKKWAQGNMKKTVSIADRKEAIRTACMLAEKGDVILVAGKGHIVEFIAGT